ncbi:hypothetical protein PF004_g16032 [Phytophthora fragariae]|uniref:Uncharacterized protein n=1 Tax=Phytophthora fragariae TaxID=53985 RepID=A0A6G0NJK4_9STRA|nr:hypothetical protein PF004_g16032 [Phytophthora fragariae]
MGADAGGTVGRLDVEATLGAEVSTVENADDEGGARTLDGTGFYWEEQANRRATAELGVYPEVTGPEVGETGGPEVGIGSAELDDSGGTHLTEVGYSAVDGSTRAALRVTVPDSEGVDPAAAGSTTTSTGLTPDSSAEIDKGAMPRDKLSTRGGGDADTTGDVAGTDEEVGDAE